MRSTLLSELDIDKSAVFVCVFYIYIYGFAGYLTNYEGNVVLNRKDAP